MKTPVLLFSWPHLAPTQGIMYHSEVVDEAEVGNGVEEVVLLGWTWIRRSVNFMPYAVYTVSLPTHYIYILCYTEKNVHKVDATPNDTTTTKRLILPLKRCFYTPRYPLL